MSDDTLQKVRARQITFMAFERDCDESKIVDYYSHYEQGIDGFAYILHDKDTFSRSDIREREKRSAAIVEAGGAAEPLPCDGDAKEPHWHVLVHWRNSSRDIAPTARWFGLDENRVRIVRGGKRGYSAMLAYLTHITDAARQEGKHQYDPSAVRGLVFPDFLETYDSYATFAEAFEAKALPFDKEDDPLLQVLSGAITPSELRNTKPDFFLKHRHRIYDARLEFVNSLPMPKSRFNFYIGPYHGSPDDASGVGKGLLAKTLAKGLLSFAFPSVDFSTISAEELREKFVFTAGGEGVALEGYSGQPVIIWNDARARTLIKAFGDISQFMNSFDSHPDDVRVNVKYGSVRLVNRINIVNGIEPYLAFIDGLSQVWTRYFDNFGNQRSKLVTEDTTQALRRFPFFVEIGSSRATFHASLGRFMTGFPELEKYDFTRTVFNDFNRLAIEDRLRDARYYRAIGQGYSKIIDALENFKPSFETVNRPLLGTVRTNTETWAEGWGEPRDVRETARLMHEDAERERRHDAARRANVQLEPDDPLMDFITSGSLVN